jgi:GWxTD domain-containing protein
MQSKAVEGIILLLVALSLSVLAEMKTFKDLPPGHKKWLEEDVAYIITPLEKGVFLRLNSDRERDLFIEAFWRQRDHSPGTPLNEFKEEHYRRIQYANRMFGRTTMLPGWKTDRGRFYILLGEPRDTERFVGEAEIYNSEIWFYQGLVNYGLPPAFNLVFFQKGGAGDFVLYSPAMDGPQALLAAYLGDQGNSLQAYKELNNISPALARVSLSLIPGESASFGRPTLASDILLQNIQALPEKEVKDSYAEKFLMYKDIVEVEYSANYIDSDSIVRPFKDRSGLTFVHYSIELNRFSVNEGEGRYSTHLRINGQVADALGKIIYQFESGLPVELSADQIKSVTYKPFDLYDMFPLVPGTYKLTVLLKNEASQEFTSLEKNFNIPGDEPAPRLSGLLLGYKTEPNPSANLMPFQLGQDQIMSQPSRVFCIKDHLFLGFQILGETPDLERNGSVRFEVLKQEERVLSLTRKISDYKNLLSILEDFPLAGFSPGTYWLLVTLQNGGQVLQTEKEPFEITSISDLPRPWVFSRTFTPVSHPGYSFALGQQYFNQGKSGRALEYLEEAQRAQPNVQSYALVLAQVYLVLKDYEKARVVLFPFQDSSRPDYDVLVTLSRTYQALGEFDQALAVMNKAILHYGVNTNLLNSLGDSYAGLGDFKQALEAWTKSLEMDPEQKEIRDRVESLKKED